MLTDEQREYQRNWYHQNKEKRRSEAREYMRQWRRQNPDKEKARGKKWRAENPDHLRNYLLGKKYGITLVRKKQMLKEQGYCCAICKSESTEGKNWHVDHCHSTKAVRGILCHHCNLMIGHAKDSADTLIAAAEYLLRHIKR